MTTEKLIEILAGYPGAWVTILTYDSGRGDVESRQITGFRLESGIDGIAGALLIDIRDEEEAFN